MGGRACDGGRAFLDHPFFLKTCIAGHLQSEEMNVVLHCFMLFYSFNARAWRGMRTFFGHATDVFCVFLLTPRLTKTEMEFTPGLCRKMVFPTAIVHFLDYFSESRTSLTIWSFPRAPDAFS